MARTAATVEKRSRERRSAGASAGHDPGRRRPAPDRIVASLVVAVVTAYVVWLVHPELIFIDTTPTQGDLGSHVHEPAYLRDHLLPHGRLSGWSQDWFTGYPSLTFYFPLGSLLVVLVDLFVPYNVAIKAVVALGPVALPGCAYLFGRLSGRDRLASACLAVAVLPLLLEPTLIISGGSIGAAAVGEYGYCLALSLGLVVLGLARAGLRTGRHRALTATLLAATVLLHLLPALLVIAGIVVSALLAPAWPRIRWAASVLVVGGAVVGFWAVPFVLRGRITAGPDYTKVGPLLKVLFPLGMAPVAAVVLLGLAAAVFAALAGERRWEEFDSFLLAMALVSAVVVAVVPTGRVWNARFLPIWMLWLCLLAGTVLAEGARVLDMHRRRRTRGRLLDAPDRVRLLLPLALVLAVVPLWDSRFGRGLLTPRGDSSPTAARIAFEGYERTPFRAEYEEFIETMRRLGREHGCGRAHWEWSVELWNDYREPLLQLVPYVTDGCVTVTEGLFSQSSASAPFIHLANSRLSPTPEVMESVRPFDLAAGVADMRVLGVRWLIASGEETQAAADVSPELRLVAQTTPNGGRRWKVYEVAVSSVVEAPAYTPVVVPGVDRTRRKWEAAVERWYDSGPGRDVVVASDGLREWPRADRVTSTPPRRQLRDVAVSRVELDDDRVSFDVSRTGTPVLVKMSYFPNWRAAGADGPWRVMPNQMVVVPTSKTVTLRYERTLVDHAGWLVTLGGAGGLVALARGGVVSMPPPVEPDTASGRPSQGRAKKRRR